MKTVLFRADASPEIGFGHVSRCLAIAADLKRIFRCVLMTKSPTQDLLGRCKDEEIECLSIQADEIGNSLMAAEARELGASVVCLDGYSFDAAYQEGLQAAGLRVAVIDDLRTGTYFADLLINHAPGARPEDYRTAGACRFMLGTDALMLHPAFWSQPRKESDRSVFVCMGGSDPSGTTGKVLKDLLAISDRPVNVILGAFKPDAEALRREFSAGENVIFMSSLSPEEMANVMARSDYGICAASTVSLEYLVVGRKLLLVKTAENQSGIYDGLIHLDLGLAYTGKIPRDDFQSKATFTKPDFATAFEDLVL